MVFENVFANLLNQYLSDFIDDVSSKQLKLAAWTGKIELKNLSVKENALDSLDLPFRVIQGTVGILSASIPWASIYTSPVILNMSNILVVAAPNVDSEYDEDRETRIAEAAKQKLLDSIEAAFKKSNESQKQKTGEKDDFVTKLSAQIVKNVQIRIDNVHIRYEDNFTDPLTPFAAGITLDQMLFETKLDQKSLKYATVSSDDIIYKLVSLKNLSCYWNVYDLRSEKNEFLSHLQYPEERQHRLLDTIAKDEHAIANMEYLLKPITFTANAMINRKPAVDDFSIPVLDLDVSLNDFKLGFNRRQFESLFQLLDALTRMRLANPHRKFRPTVSLHGNAKAWWQFAISAVLENEVKRKNKQWSWQHIRSHVVLLKEYLSVYQDKLLNPKKKEFLEAAAILEKKLDVFNIVLVRRRAEAEVATRLKAIEEEKKEKKKNSGWFSSWWGSSDQTDGEETVDVIEDFKKEMTSEEKEKLYEAIGYEAGHLDFPPDFKAHLLSLNIRSIKLDIIDDSIGEQILNASLVGFLTNIKHRPASKGIEVSASVSSVVAFGIKNRPLINDVNPDKALQIDFISNPVSKDYDFGIFIKTNPLHLVHDSLTVNALTGMISKSSDASIAEIQALAEVRLSKLKNMSATGLEYAISQKPDILIRIDLAPFFLIIPSGDMWDDSTPSDALIACLGRVTLKSSQRREGRAVRELSETETPESIIQHFRERAYDSYELKLSELQVILTTSQSWKDDIGFDRGNEYIIKEEKSILKPVTLEVTLQRCLVTDDPDLPKFKVNAVIPQFAILASDMQLIRALTILMEMPSAPAKEKTDAPLGDNISIGLSLDEPDSYTRRFNFMRQNALSEEEIEVTDEVDANEEATELKDVVDFVGDFTINELVCEFLSGKNAIMKIVIKEVGASVTQDAFTMEAKAHIGHAVIETMSRRGEIVYLLETLKNEQLLCVHYLSIDKKSPKYDDVSQKISITVSELSSTLDHLAIGNLMAWNENITKHLPQKKLAEVSAELRRSASSISNLSGIMKSKKLRLRKKKKTMSALVMLVQMEANFDIKLVSVSIKNVCSMFFEGLKGTYTLYESSRTSVDLEWNRFLLQNDISDDRKMTHKNIVRSAEREGLLKLSLVMFSEEELKSELTNVDMTVGIVFGELKIVYLAEFFSALSMFSSNFEEAKQRALEATYAAAEAAKQSAISAYEKCTKLGLNISLEAPKIFIPQNWESPDCLIIDLGKIDIKNSFKTKQKAVLDFMQVNLSSTHIRTRDITFVKDNNQDDNVILSPISFTVAVQRNLTFIHHKIFPELDVSARLEGVFLNVSQHDIQLIMKIMSENLGAAPKDSDIEITTERPRSPVPLDLPIFERSLLEVPLQNAVILEEADVHVDAEVPQERVYKRMKFDFCLPDMGVCLYDGPNKSDNEKLCEARLIEFHVFGEQFTDESMNSSLIIENILLRDARQEANENAINKFLYTKFADNSDEELKMLKIMITMKGSTDLLVDMHMKGITLIFALDYLLRVYGVLMEGLVGDQEEKSKVDFPQTVGSLDTTATKITPTKESMTIVFDFHMTKSDIVLIESVVNDDCPALIMNSLFELSVKQREDQLSLVGKVAQIQLAMANLRGYQTTNEVEAYVLNPCDLDFVGKIDGEANTKRLDLIMDNLHINVSPNTVQVILSILSSIGAENADQQRKEEEKVRIQTSDLLIQKSFQDSYLDFWFLKKSVSASQEVTEETDVASPESPKSLVSSNTSVNKDQLMIKIPVAKIVVETGGLSSLPVLHLETSFSGRLDGWTKLQSSLTLQMNYYNERTMAWEPVIEPIDGSSEKWCTQMRAKITEENGSSKTSVNFESTERMEITISKTFLSLSSRLGEAFARAAKKTETLSKQSELVHVINSLGVDLMIVINEERYEYDAKHVVRNNGSATIILYPQETVVLDQIKNMKGYKEEAGDFIVRFMLDGKDIVRNIALKSRCKRIYDLPVLTYPTHRIQWLLNVETSDFGSKKVTLGSPVEIFNNMFTPIAVYVYEDNEAKKLTEIESNNRWFIPLSVMHSDHELLFVAPAKGDHCIPNVGIPFKDHSNIGKQLLNKCEPKTDAELKRAVNMIIVMASYNVLYEDTNKRSAKFIALEVNPTLILQNLLPNEINHNFRRESLLPGQKAHLGAFDPSDPEIQIVIPEYLGQSWICKKKIEIADFEEEDVFVWTFNSISSPTTDLSKQGINLAMSLSKPALSKPIIAQLFSPFWLVNDIGTKLTLRSGDSLYDLEANSNQPFFFSFRPGKLFKQKVQIRVNDSHWSDGFSIDAVGNKGNIYCKDRSNENFTYCISVDIALSSISLTKIVTFTPFYKVINSTEVDVSVSDDKNNWCNIEKGTSVPFWPGNSKMCHFYIKIGAQVSTPVTFLQSNTALVAVANQLINVIVDVSDSEIKIQLTEYDEGSCPLRIFNQTSSILTYWQQGSTTKRALHPDHSVYIVWDEPSGERIIVWQVDDCEEKSFEPIQDELGGVTNGKFFWVSFLDGLQRTLLITPDYELTKSALQTIEFTQPKTVIETSFKGLGISLVNDELQQDIIYMGIKGYDRTWEIKKTKSKRYKPLQMRYVDILETAYQREVTRRKVIEEEDGANAIDNQSAVLTVGNLKVDLTNLEDIKLLEPVKGDLRRYSSPGFWALVNLSDHSVQTHAKIGRIQIDNQTDNCLFNIIMCPVAPPKSLSMDRTPKSFIELSTVLLSSTNVSRFKYFSVLIQEFLVQIDGAFLLTMSEFFGTTEQTQEVDYEILIKNDVKAISEKCSNTEEQKVVLSKYFFDLIHFSPIKVHVSFSLAGTSSFQVLGVLDLLMRSAGVTLTEFKDVTFKIDFFERKNIFVDQSELISLATSHYVRQVLKQFYVIVLGLDVIGNPVGLVMGLKEGVGDFFYEPFLGIIEGPEEFAEGLAFGVKSLLSHTVGGAADALSRITGTIGEGVSALTMDDDFIRKRRSRKNRQQTVAESGKDLASGFWRGITGIIRKPIEGARDDGFEGLMKGIGKGAVGVIAQPATGVIDFASGSLGALKKAVDISSEAKKQRPARLFQRDGVLPAYNLHEAIGNQILHTIEKGSFAESDHYLTHCLIRGTGNSSKEIVVLITDLRIFVLKESCMYSNWQVDWKEEFNDITDVQIENATVVKITLKEQRLKLCIINDGFERRIFCQTHEAAQWLLDRINRAKLSMQ